MKEYINSFDPEEYHGKIYKLVLNNDLAGQHDLYGNILFVNNEEKNPVVNYPEPVVKEKPNPLQGEFIIGEPKIGYGH
jgi:hypothetical protein